jgi:hypothetical protein
MYVLSKDIAGFDHEQFKSRIADYEQYLSSIKEKLSLSPEGFIFDDWYKDRASHRCLHDSWLTKLFISESSDNQVDIQLTLLGAYHDGQIILTYSDVQYYRLDRNKNSAVVGSHGDLRYEEFRMDDKGNMIHEFDWYTKDENAVFLIACKHICYEWREFESGQAPERTPEWKINSQP